MITFEFEAPFEKALYNAFRKGINYITPFGKALLRLLERRYYA